MGCTIARSHSRVGGGAGQADADEDSPGGLVARAGPTAATADALAPRLSCETRERGREEVTVPPEVGWASSIGVRLKLGAGHPACGALGSSRSLGSEVSQFWSLS